MSTSSDPAAPAPASWPLLGLRLIGSGVELRLPSTEELLVLAEAAGADDWLPTLPFLSVRSDTPVQRGRRTLQQHWAALGAWTPQAWSLDLAVFRNGRPVGLQNVRSHDFAARREVVTGSWVVPGQRGVGTGRAMRAAVLELAFTGLGARGATSTAQPGNVASLRVSQRLGYQTDGTVVHEVDGETVEERRLRISADQWRQHRVAAGVQLVGVAACRPLFGLPD